MAKKARNSGISKHQLLVPFNILDFGDIEKDPCFGKHYDLTDDTCLSCGDLEWCATIFNQRVVKKRLEEERNGTRFDLDIASLEFKKDVKEFYNKLIKEGRSRVRARKTTASRFSSKMSHIKTIVNGQ